jgi:hypothetical protein
MWQKLERTEMHTAGREGTFGGPGNVWENNIKMNLVYMGCEGMV